MSVEQKLQELAQLAEELKLQEAKEVDQEEDDCGDEESDEEDEQPKGKKSKESEIEMDDEKKETNDVKESKIDLGALFDGETLSEEFKIKATAVFEAAVATRVQQEVAELEESFEQKALTESTELKESLVDKIDGYLDFMVEQWMEKNELAINRGIKTEILESFVSSMKNVFESHYIDVPDEKYDLVEAAQAEAKELEARLDEEVAKNVEMNRALKGVQRQAAIDEACVEMVGTDAERFRQLADELSFTEEFETKLQAIKESYFPVSKKEESKVITEEFMTDTPVEIIEEQVKPAVDSTMSRYLAAIERTGAAQ